MKTNYKFTYKFLCSTFFVLKILKWQWWSLRSLSGEMCVASWDLYCQKLCRYKNPRNIIITLSTTKVIFKSLQMVYKKNYSKKKNII
jgi:hypothetical protein